ncbi:hypothetical protein GF362_00820 [Candidatus Dojkabacteria bacterium]|nr:hypothetical protein [Candidatus Dojkabacteria bacterium]
MKLLKGTEKLGQYNNKVVCINWDNFLNDFESRFNSYQFKKSLCKFTLLISIILLCLLLFLEITTGRIIFIQGEAFTFQNSLILISINLLLFSIYFNNKVHTPKNLLTLSAHNEQVVNLEKFINISANKIISEIYNSITGEEINLLKQLVSQDSKIPYSIRKKIQGLPLHRINDRSLWLKQLLLVCYKTALENKLNHIDQSVLAFSLLNHQEL